MSKISEYQEKLVSISDWDAYLLQESGLPGPRGNIELAHAVANLGNQELFERYLGYTAEKAPVNSPYEFLAFCGTVGLGRLLANGDLGKLPILHGIASDPRWRMREAVAMALQRLGEVNMTCLLEEMDKWCSGSYLEQRAAAAALCEPKLLGEEKFASHVLDILDRITASIQHSADRHGVEFITLRKGLGYCWSVAVVALPHKGKALMEKWFKITDPDIRWIMLENLKKSRLLRIDVGWVERWKREMLVKRGS